MEKKIMSSTTEVFQVFDNAIGKEVHKNLLIIASFLVTRA